MDEIFLLNVEIDFLVLFFKGYLCADFKEIFKIKGSISS